MHHLLAEVVVPTGGAENGLKKITSIGFIVVGAICLVLAIYVTRWISGIFSWLASIPRILLVVLVLVAGSFFGFITINFAVLKK
jgi:hypothetical protein